MEMTRRRRGAAILLGLICMLSIWLLTDFTGYEAYGAEISRSGIAKQKKPTIKIAGKTARTVTLEWGSVKQTDGYQIYRATSKNGPFKKIKIVKSSKYKDKNLKAGTKYYYKVRAYKVVKGKRYFGKFSDVKKCRTEYTYQLYYLDDYKKLYTDPCYSEQSFHDGEKGTTVFVYIKTKDPNPEAFDFLLDDEDFLFHGYSPQIFDDVRKSVLSMNRYRADYEKVKGGYVTTLTFDRAGTHNIRFVRIKEKYKLDNGEYAWPQKGNYSVKKRFQIKCISYKTGYNQWIKNLVNKHTTKKMNSIEKMQAVADYLSSEESGFTYLPNKIDKNGELKLVRLGLGEKSCEQPFWVNKCWDSWISPSVLEDIAKHIGGFSSVENLYYKYKFGTQKWTSYHWYCRVKYKGKSYYFGVCPLPETGTLKKIEKPNFGDTSWMYKID